MKRALLVLLLSASIHCKAADPAPALQPEEAIAQASERTRSSDTLAWPTEPMNGSPVAAVFQEIHKDDTQRRARLRLFNFSSNDVSQVTMQLHCADSEENPIPCVGSGEKPDSWWTSSISLPANGHGTHTVSATLPSAIVHVSAEIHSVLFKDGKRWPSDHSSP
jgi:hypothetical protein